MTAVRFNVQNTTLPVTIGIPVRQADNILNTTALRIKAPGGAVVPASFRVLSRWRGLANDGTKPVKWVLADFTPTVTGEHTLTDTAEAQTLPADLVVTNNAGDIRVQTSALDARFPKSGADLISQFLLSSVEQFAAGSKPQLKTAVNTAAITTSGLAAAGQNQITVSNAAGLAVNDQVKLKYEGTHAFTQGGAVVLNENLPYWDGTGLNRQFRMEPGGANQEDFTLYYIDPANGRAQLFYVTGQGPALSHAAGVVVRDQTLEADFVANGYYTITAISGSIVTLNRNLPVAMYEGVQVVKSGASGPVNMTSQITGCVIEEQNAHRVVVKQTGFIGVTSAQNELPDFTFDLRWYCYAGQGFTRGRLRFKNITSDPNHAVIFRLFDDLRIAFPTAAAVTASDVAITTLAAATARIVAGDIHTITTETALAGNLKVTVPEFAEKFPQRLAASGNTIDWYIFAPLGGGNTTRFWEDWTLTWDFYVGANPATVHELTSRPGALPNASDYCSSGAIRRALVPAQTWTTGQFGTAELAEAANRTEKLFACGYNLDVCDSQGVLGSTPRATMFEHRLGSQLYPGSTHNMGQMFGWDQYGNLRSDQDGLTYNRYDVPFVLLREFCRTGDERAWTLGSQHARLMADGGTFQSDELQNNNPEMNFKGWSRYERSSDPVTGTQNPRPSHSWSEGLWLWWALTGDPIAYETCLLHRARAINQNYNGTNPATSTANQWLLGASTTGEARHAGWAAMEVFAAYWYYGDTNDLTICKQYLDHLRLNEEAQGNHGYFNFDGVNSATAMSAYVWAGYPSIALYTYLREMRALGTPDTALENFLIREADWIIKGDASAASPDPDRPLVGGDTVGGLYRPLALRDFVNGQAFDYSQAYAVTLDICVVVLIGAARLSGRSDLRSMADQAFRDVAFYRDTGNGQSVNPTSRTPINFNNLLFRSTSAKVYGQTGIALAEYIPDAITATPAPSVTTISPAAVTAGGAQFVLTVNGSDFQNGAVVTVGGQDRTTTFVSTGQLTATVLAADIAAAGTKAVVVRNPDSQVSNSVNLTITSAAAPSISSISPNSATAGGAQFTLTVNGTNFVSGATVRWNGSNRTTTFVSGTQLTATIPLTDIAAAGSATVTVQNPDAQVSGGSAFTINNPAPALTSISPTSKTAGDAQFTLTCTGSNFVNGSIVRVGGSDRVTTFVSDTQLTATIPASDIATAGTLSITVFNPAPGGGTSNSVSLTVNAAGAPAPVISSLAPSSATAGGAAFTLTVNGSNFVSGAKARWNGFERTTAFISATEMRAQIPASDLAQPGTAQISVINPDNQLSGNLAFTNTPIPLRPGLPAAKRTLIVRQGDTFSFAFQVKLVNAVVGLNGVTGRMQIRPAAADETSQVILTISDGAGITIDQANHVITLRFTAAQTAGWKWRAARYDLELTSQTGEVVTVLEGDIRVRKEITR